MQYTHGIMTGRLSINCDVMQQGKGVSIKKSIKKNTS